MKPISFSELLDSVQEGTRARRTSWTSDRHVRFETNQYGRMEALLVAGGTVYPWDPSRDMFDKDWELLPKPEKTVKVRLDYFKESGEWYLDTNWSVPKTHSEMSQIRRLLRDRIRRKDLPGLTSKAWSGPIMITVIDEDGSGGLPAMILPGNQVKEEEEEQ